MEIQVIREIFTEKSTIGSIMVNGQFVCYSLEDKDRHLEKNPSGKIKGETAIPLGRYAVSRTMSPRFKKVLPRLSNVPGFEGVLIHTGNTDKDTEGCILTGTSRQKDFVGESRKAFAILDAMIKKALDNKENVFITIERKA